MNNTQLNLTPASSYSIAKFEPSYDSSNDYDKDINDIYADIQDALADQAAYKNIKEAVLVENLKNGKMGMNKLLGIQKKAMPPKGETMKATSAPQEASPNVADSDEFLRAAQEAAVPGIRVGYDALIQGTADAPRMETGTYRVPQSAEFISADLAAIAKTGISETGAYEAAMAASANGATIAQVEATIYDIEHYLEQHRKMVEEIMAARAAAVNSGLSQDDFALGA